MLYWLFDPSIANLKMCFSRVKPMIKFIKTNNTDTINRLRSELYKQLTAPIDAMWEQLYIASSQHYLIQAGDSILGFCCINGEGCLMQIFLEQKYYAKMIEVFEELIKSEMINSASLSSNEPVGFNACLFHSKSNKPNTFCFEHLNTLMAVNSTIDLELASVDDIPAIKSFYKEQVGMDDTFGYTENLVKRKEIFIVRESGVIISVSERRMSDSQPDIADLGIIVHMDYQGRSIATQAMQLQVNSVLKLNRKPICSTTCENIASRKVIENSGFYCSNIIFDFSFDNS